MKTTRYGAALVAAFAATTVGASAIPARAAAFPLLTFRIVNTYSGMCADANFGSGIVGPKPCSSTSLYQKWTWDRTTGLLINAGAGKCAWASLTTSYAVGLAACDGNELEQQFESVSYMSTGERIAHIHRVVPDEGWYYYQADRGFSTDKTFGAPNTRLAFTFPLV